MSTAVDAMVEESGFEPLKLKATDLQSAPFGHSGTPPCLPVLQNRQVLVYFAFIKISSKK